MNVSVTRFVLLVSLALPGCSEITTPVVRSGQPATAWSAAVSSRDEVCNEPFASVVVAGLGLVGIVLFATPARPCARVLLSNSGRAVVVGRSMNWQDDLKAELWAFPRGIERKGLAGKNPLKWRTKYGSVAVKFLNLATADGVNEKGLAVSVLWLDEADYGPRDEAVPGLSTTLWGQFYLDNFATVTEAVKFKETTPIQLVPIKNGREVSHLHLALADATGDTHLAHQLPGHLVHTHHRLRLIDRPLVNLQHILHPRYEFTRRLTWRQAPLLLQMRLDLVFF